MKKLSWMLTIAGLVAILGGVLYPMGVITKQSSTVLLLAGAFAMFIGSMIRTYTNLRRK